MNETLKTRSLKTHEIAEAFAMWAKAKGYEIYSLGTRQVSETEITVEASVVEGGVWHESAHES